MGQEKIQVRACMNESPVGVWGSQDKGLLGTTHNLEAAQGRWQALSPIHQIVRALPTPPRATAPMCCRPRTALRVGTSGGGEACGCVHHLSDCSVSAAAMCAASPAAAEGTSPSGQGKVLCHSWGLGLLQPRDAVVCGDGRRVHVPHGNKFRDPMARI